MPARQAQLRYHRRYLENEWFWRFYWIAYHGGREWLRPPIPFSPITTLYGTQTGSAAYTPIGVSGLSRQYTMLSPFPREEDPDYWRRLERARYDNHCQPLVRQIVGHVLEDDPVERGTMAGDTITPFDGPMEDYLKDVDLAGQDRQAWMHWGLTLASIFGHAHALTEVPALPFGVDPPANAEQARAIDQRPYSVWFSPMDVPNWDVDERGQFKWIVLRYPYMAAERSPTGETSAEVSRYRFWYPDHWEDWVGGPEQPAKWTHRDEGEAIVQIGEGVNALGRVPVDTLYYARDVSSRDPLGVSVLTDVAFLNRSLFNVLSLADQQLYEQTFSWLAIPGGHKLKKLALSVQRFFGFDPGAGGGMPAFIAPPDGPTRMLLDVADRIELKIRVLSGFGKPTDQSVSVRSGAALAFEAGDKATELMRTRALAQAFELKNLRTVAAWIPGVDASAFEVRYGQPRVAAVPTAAAAPAEGVGANAAAAGSDGQSLAAPSADMMMPGGPG